MIEAQTKIVPRSRLVASLTRLVLASVPPPQAQKRAKNDFPASKVVQIAHNCFSFNISSSKSSTNFVVFSSFLWVKTALRPAKLLIPGRESSVPNRSHQATTLRRTFAFAV